MSSVFRSGWILVGTALLCVLMSACAQTLRIRATPGDRVIIGITDTAAHLRRDFYFGPHQPTRRVIRQQRDLDGFWSTLQTHIPPPTVDFSQRDVLAVGFGSHGSEGPTISIDTVLTRGQERIAVVRTTYLTEACLVPSVVTAPFDIVVVPRDSTRTTQFVERSVRSRSCFPSPNPIRR
jgi:hypothetical protein